MHPEVARHIPEIRALCREFGVARLEVFGSAVTDAFDPARSDADFLVTYPDGYDFGLWLVRFFDFDRALAGTLQREVDLIMHDAPRNPRFVAELNRTKSLVYDAAEHAHAA